MMCGPDACTNGRHQLECLYRTKLFFASEHVVERFALDVLHHEERRAAVDDAIIGDAYNVLVTNGGGREGLLSKPRNELRIVADEVGQDHLDGELGLKVSVPGLVHHAHAP